MSTPRGRGKLDRSVGVQAMEVGLELLRPLVAARTPLNLKTLSKDAGFSPPKAHRYLVSMIRSGLVEQDDQTGRYALGPLGVELGLTALGMLDPDRIGRSALVDLRVETDHTTSLIVWGTAGPTVASVEPSFSAGAYFMALRVGSILSLMRSASGHIFLAYLPRRTVWPLLEKECRALKARTDGIGAIISETRRRGYSAVTDALVPGVRAISVPVFDHEGHLTYALTCFGQTGSFNTSADGPLLKMVLARARVVSGRLGFTDCTIHAETNAAS